VRLSLRDGIFQWRDRLAFRIARSFFPRYARDGRARRLKTSTVNLPVILFHPLVKLLMSISPLTRAVTVIYVHTLCVHNYAVFKCLSVCCAPCTCAVHIWQLQSFNYICRVPREFALCDLSQEE